MSRNKSFNERLKNMKESIEKNKDLLNKNFPDDVTTTGNPDLIRDKDKCNADNTKGDDDEEPRNKKS